MAADSNVKSKELLEQGIKASKKKGLIIKYTKPKCMFIKLIKISYIQKSNEVIQKTENKTY